MVLGRSVLVTANQSAQTELTTQLHRSSTSATFANLTDLNM